MKELLDKISSYNIFNFLLPGIVFTVLLPALGFSAHHLAPDNLLIAAFLYYFVGLVISRFGSLVIEPLLKRSGFVKFAPYSHFIEASRKDAVIDVLSEVNNTYRTLCAMSALLLLLPAYRFLEGHVQWLAASRLFVVALVLFVVFLLSYRKQTDYVRRRVEAVRLAALPSDKK